MSKVCIIIADIPFYKCILYCSIFLEERSKEIKYLLYFNIYNWTYIIGLQFKVGICYLIDWVSGKLKV